MCQNRDLEKVEKYSAEIPADKIAQKHNGHARGRPEIQNFRQAIECGLTYGSFSPVPHCLFLNESSFMPAQQDLQHM